MARPLKAFPFDCDARAGIYGIKNSVNGLIYIGSAIGFYRRWKRHYNELIQGLHPNEHFQRAWDKYGPEAFTWETLEVTEKTRESLLSKEQEWLDRGFAEGNLYNICKVAGSHVGVVRSDETKQKLREALIKRGGRVEFDRNDEWKKQISEANTLNKGTRCSSESFKQKIRESKMGNKNTTGKIHAFDSNGNGFRVLKDDLRLVSGELKRGRILAPYTKKDK